MNLNQAARSIVDAARRDSQQFDAAQNLALALALCGADRQLRDAVEEEWFLDSSSEDCSGEASSSEESSSEDSSSEDCSSEDSSRDDFSRERLDPAMPAANNDGPPGPGSIVAGRFSIIRELGHGGTGTVFQADDETGRPVALKVAYPGAEVAAGSCPLRAEYTAASAVQHPNVRRVDELFTLESRAGRAMQAMVMEYIDGETLATRISRGPLPGDELAGIARGLAAGLDAIHAAGLVHGDLKPGNIVLRKDLSPAIVDLGNGGTAISPDYMSVEQFEGKPATPADDLFALGAILYEMATGNRPWPKEEILPAAIRRATKDVPLLTNVPTGYATAVAALLDRNPALRPPSATQALTLVGLGRITRTCRHRHPMPGHPTPGRQGSESA